MFLSTFLPGNSPPSPGFAPWEIFDLDLIGIGQVFDRHAEAARRNLLDRRSLGVTVFQRREPNGILAAFARVALAAQSIHRDRERFVRLGTDTAKAHRTGTKSLDDFAGGLNVHRVKSELPVSLKSSKPRSVHRLRLSALI